MTRSHFALLLGVFLMRHQAFAEPAEETQNALVWTHIANRDLTKAYEQWLVLISTFPIVPAEHCHSLKKTILQIHLDPAAKQHLTDSQFSDVLLGCVPKSASVTTDPQASAAFAQETIRLAHDKKCKAATGAFYRGRDSFGDALAVVEKAVAPCIANSTYEESSEGKQR